MAGEEGPSSSLSASSSSRSDANKEDVNGPAGYPEEERKRTNPMHWPLTLKEWDKLLDLLEEIAALPKPTSKKILQRIGEAEIWGEGLPHWAPEDLFLVYHPTKIQLAINRSIKYGEPEMDPKKKKKIIEAVNAALASRSLLEALKRRSANRC